MRNPSLAIFMLCLTALTSISVNAQTKYDVAFVLRGYDNSCYYCDSLSFDARAKEIIGYLNKMSFGKISTYRIFYNGNDSRSPVNLQSTADINTLQAALNGWPGSQWDWLRNRTDYWATVPASYVSIVNNAIAWMQSTKLDLASWGKQTAEGKLHYAALQNNIQRMGPSSAQDFLKDLKMPQDYSPTDYRYTEIVLNSKNNTLSAGGGAQNVIWAFGLKDFNGNAYPTNLMANATYVYHSPRNNNSIRTVIYTSVHEGIHGAGMGTHDIDGKERNLSVMSSFGNIESFSMLPAWDRYYWTKWLTKSTITTDSTQVADLKSKGAAADANLKYIFQVVAGDSLGRGGSYKEKYDGKWYSYTVDQMGTLTFTSDFTNNNTLQPVNAVLDVPVVHAVKDTVIFYIEHDG